MVNIENGGFSDAVSFTPAAKRRHKPDVVGVPAEAPTNRAVLCFPPEKGGGGAPPQHKPVEGDGRHGVNAGENGGDGEEVVEAAVNGAKVPFVMDGVGEVDDRVEG